MGDALDRAIQTVLMPGFRGYSAPAWLLDELDAGLGGVCLFGMNVIDRAQLGMLTGGLREANPNIVIAIDEEGGEVSRLDHLTGSDTPTAAHLGRIDDTALTREVYQAIGRDLTAVGVTADFAPDADVNSNPRNPVIGTRSFGADAELVSRHVAAAVTGLQQSFVAAVTKHFPGHGDTAVDSHLGLPTVDLTEQQLRERELLPFLAAIGAGVRGIMTSHILLPDLDAEAPATMSRRILTELLRGELGYTGTIVSDALDMRGASGSLGIPEAAVRALAAGCDLLCIGTDNTATQLAELRAHVREAVRDGRLSESRLLDAAERARALGASAQQEHAPGGGSVEAGQAAHWVRPQAFVVRRPIAAVGANPVLVRIQDTPNNAVGTVEWGLGDYLGDALAQVFPGALCVDIHPGEALPARLLGDGRAVVVQARGMSVNPDTARAVADVREAALQAVVVELGWADASAPGEWDIATFGANRALALALAAMLRDGVTAEGVRA